LTAGLTALETAALSLEAHPEDELLRLLLAPYPRGVVTQALRRALRRVEVYLEKQTLLDRFGHYPALTAKPEPESA
jgi:hypothetical protein